MDAITKREKPIDRWLAIGGIAVGILLFLAPKTPLTVVSLLIIVFALLIHPIWHFWWIEVKLWRKLGVTLLFILVLVWFGRISWPPESSGYSQIVTAQAESYWRWLIGPHGRWLDKAIGAIYTLVALFLLLLFLAAAQSLRKVRNRGESQKGFLDYKLDAEKAMTKMPPMLEKLTKIMTEVGPAINKHTETLLRAGSTEDQLRVVRAAAASLDGYSRRVNRVRDEFAENGRLLSDGFSGWSVWIKKSRPAKATLGAFPELLRHFTGTISTANSQLSGYIETTRAMKGTSSVLDAAIDRHVEPWEAIAHTNSRIFEACRSALVIIDELA